MAPLSHVWSFLPFGLSFATDLGDAVEKFHIGFVQCRFVAPLPRHSWSLVITPPTPSARANPSYWFEVRRIRSFLPDINGPSAQSIRAFAGALWQCIRVLGFTVCLQQKLPQTGRSGTATPSSHLIPHQRPSLAELKFENIMEVLQV
ncbi:hypothetical protein VTI28DRAFT_1083 [Corynascus sepedonium]